MSLSSDSPLPAPPHQPVEPVELAAHIAAGFRCRGHSPDDLRQEAVLVALEHSDDPDLPDRIRRHLEGLTRADRRRVKRTQALDDPPAPPPADLPALADLPLDVLTRRQRQVMERTAEGAGDADLAAELGITVESLYECRSRAIARLREAI